MKGLMFHEPLKMDECAFFDFSSEGKHSFWNNNVDFPISLIFCNKHGKIEDIKYLEAGQKSAVYPCSYNVKYVVEAHADAPKKYSIKNGSYISNLENEIIFI